MKKLLNVLLFSVSFQMTASSVFAGSTDISAFNESSLFADRVAAAAILSTTDLTASNEQIALIGQDSTGGGTKVAIINQTGGQNFAAINQTGNYDAYASIVQIGASVMMISQDTADHPLSLALTQNGTGNNAIINQH